MSTHFVLSAHPTFTPRVQAWAFLSRLADGAHPAIVRELYATGEPDPVTLVHRICHSDPTLPPELAAAVPRPHVPSPLEDLIAAEQRGIRLITPDEAEWPRELFATAFATPTEPAVTRPDPTEPARPTLPVALWVTGRALDSLLTTPAVTIVGPRASSGYGNRVAADLTSDLAREGHTVVTPVAWGIAEEVLRTATHDAGDGDGAARAIAVVPHGLDTHFPTALGAAVTEVTRRGAVISEYPVGVKPARVRFLDRNRLIAALAATTVVVEGTRRSSPDAVARWTSAMGRPLCAIPGNVTAPTSELPNGLIRNGRARAVTNGHDIIQAVTHGY